MMDMMEDETNTRPLLQHQRFRDDDSWFVTSSHEKLDCLQRRSSPLNFPVIHTAMTTANTSDMKRTHPMVSKSTIFRQHQHYPKYPQSLENGPGLSAIEEKTPKPRIIGSNLVSRVMHEDNHSNHCKQNKAFTPLPPDFVPGPFDVICGRGAHIKKHPGNVLFKQKIQECLPAYAKATSKLQKSIIVSSVVEFFRHRSNSSSTAGTGGGGGGFVKESTTPRSSTSTTSPGNSPGSRQDVVVTWSAVSEYWAREKTGQAFRDQLSHRYKSATKTKRRRWKQEEQKAVHAAAQQQQQRQQEVDATSNATNSKPRGAIPPENTFPRTSSLGHSNYQEQELGLDVVPMHEMNDQDYNDEDWWSLDEADNEDPSSSLSFLLDECLNICVQPHIKRFVHDVQTEKMELDRLQNQFRIPEQVYEAHLESLLTRHNQRLLHGFKTDRNIQGSLHNAIASAATTRRMDRSVWPDPVAVWNPMECLEWGEG
jgi:hypothetical protein